MLLIFNSQQGEMALTDADILLQDNSNRSRVQRSLFLLPAIVGS